MHIYLVQRPLHERAVNAAEGFDTLYTKASGEGHGMLLSYPHIEGTFGEALPNFIESSPTWHGRCDGHYRPVVFHNADQ